MLETQRGADNSVCITKEEGHPNHEQEKKSEMGFVDNWTRMESGASGGSPPMKKKTVIIIL
ncbi:hypothetical protein Dimus_028735 [Dionaea muscipula]